MEKTRANDLAILGAAPAFAEPLHVGRPNVGDRAVLLRRINDMLDRRWFTNNGPLVRELEERIAAMVGVRHCVLVSSGTTALELAIRATGMTGEAIVPAYTFVATAHALQWLGLTPVFCDIDRRTHNLHPAHLETLLTERTSGIIGVHLWGRPCAVEALTEIAARRNLVLLFDAAHGFACSHGARMIGSFGRAEVFSFHATKFFHTFEGGAVTCDDDELAAKLRLQRNFGFSGLDNVIALGSNAKLSEIAAAMGLTLLDGLDDLIAHNRRNYRLYAEHAEDIPGVTLTAYDESSRNNFQYIVLEIDESETGIPAADLIAVLRAENIFARRYFYPGCHRMEPYRTQLAGRLDGLLPETDRLASRVVCLPNGTSIGEKEINAICRLLRLVVREGPALRARLGARSA